MFIFDVDTHASNSSRRRPLPQQDRCAERIATYDSVISRPIQKYFEVTLWIAVF